MISTKYGDTQHRNQPINTEIASIGGPLPEIRVEDTSESSDPSDAVTDDGLLLLEGVKMHRDLQVYHDVLPRNDMLHDYLDQTLRHARMECVGEEGKYFMPVNGLDRIICHDTTRRYLSSIGQPRILSQLEEITAYICGNRGTPEELHTGKRVFASLILANKADTVALLYDERIRDQDLPLMKTDRIGSTFKFKKRNSGDSILRCFSDWKDGEMELFDKHQREMKPPFFARDSNSQPLHYELRSGSCLPWIQFGDNIHTSSNSDVRCVEIHPAQHDLPSEVSIFRRVSFDQPNPSSLILSSRRKGEQPFRTKDSQIREETRRIQSGSESFEEDPATSKSCYTSCNFPLQRGVSSPLPLGRRQKSARNVENTSSEAFY